MSMILQTMEKLNLERAQNEAGGIQGEAFSAVVQEIFQQAQTEIDAGNRNIIGSHFDSAPSLDFQPSVHDATTRYEPLLDPALTYISNILAEVDEFADERPCLTLDEFFAYEAKATEMAALLKEDSPSLTLKLDPDVPVSPGASLIPASEASYLQSSVNHTFVGDILSYPDIGTPLFGASASSEPFQNRLFLNSLGGPLSPQASSLLQVQVQEVLSPDSQGSTQLSPAERPESHDDSHGASSQAKKFHKPKKAGNVLRPRKESARKKSSGKSRSSRDGDPGFVDINDLLLQAAQAVGVNNKKWAVEILNKVRQHASPYGNAAQRLAYFFAEAMDARFSGTGWPLFLGLLRRGPSSAEILKATYKYMESCPFVKAYHYFINQTILNVAKGASKLHILELQTTGFQYPSLLEALAARPGGPPQVRLIGLGFPHYSMMPARTDVVLEGIQKTGRHLSEYAASCGVPFEFVAWAGARENLRMQDFVSPERNSDEVLVVISAHMLRYIMDETSDSAMVRLKLLKMGRDTNPDVYIQGVIHGSYSTPFFTRRFREALFHFESVFDMLDTFIERENEDRLVFEREVLGKAILNIVACEGTEIGERIDKYKHWQLVTEEVGFEQLPLDEEIKKNVQVMLETWHKEYTVTEDSPYLLMGWKGRMLHAMSTWKASAS